ncbi:MarR family transcriptional regulator [Ectothiorhodospiraceae bacterium BW-2]|nr:MarR family transcriptional regulator [Ectothiorhodospiraceae bacterium BW-2]
MNTHEQVLVALRQIIRAIDLNSKKLERESGLTGPQLVVLHAIGESEDSSISAGEVARRVSLSQATVTSILDRMERKGVVRRRRSESDRRKVYLSLTEQGAVALQQAPQLMQQSFIEAFSRLEQWEQSLLLSSLQRVASMMDANELDAAPLIDSASAEVDEAY